MIVQESKIKEVQSALEVLKQHDLIYLQSEMTIQRWIGQQRSEAAQQERNRIERGKAMYLAYVAALSMEYPNAENAWKMMHSDKRRAWMLAADHAANWKAAE